MKLYVVFGGGSTHTTDDWAVIGVYTTQRRAAEALVTVPNGEIQEFGLDDLPPTQSYGLPPHLDPMRPSAG